MTTIVVTAAVIEREGTYLVTRRLEGTHLAGLWEFPGGKCDDGESLVECLEREIAEELGAAVIVGDEILHITHAYPERSVTLHFFRCALNDEPRPLLGQEVRWVARADLKLLDFPPADDRLIEMLVSQA